MPNFAPALETALQTHRQTLVEHACAVAHQRGLDLPRPAVEQLIHGFETLIRESLAEQGDDARRFFLDTAVPGLKAQGETATSLAGSATAFGVLLAAEVLPAVPEAQRADATAWIAGFLGDYVRDLVAAAGAAA